MKDELSLAGETEDVQAVKAKIMKLFKDIVSKSYIKLGPDWGAPITV